MIVLCNGCFDPLHYGHVKHLQAARKMGDLLYVSITADAFVNKGPGRPAFNQNQRAEVVRALECVHGVLIVESSLEALRNIMPDIFVKGSEYRSRISHQDLAFCKENGIEIRFTEEETYSSTKLLNHGSRSS